MDDTNPAGGTDPAAPPAAAPPAAPPANPAWYANLDPETLAYVQSKKVDALPNWTDAFKQVADFHKQAEAYIGIPADQRLRAPNPTDSASVNAFWEKFGAQTEPGKYDLSGIKFSDGTDLDPQFVTTVQTLAHKHHLPLEATQALAKDFTGFLEAQDKAEAEATQARLTEQRTNLQKLWGPNYQANLALADLAAKRVGLDVDAAALLGEKVGVDKVLEALRKIGAATSEDSFVASNPNSQGAPPMTVIEGREKLNALQADKEFGARLIAGDVAAKKEWDIVFASAHPDLIAAAAA